MADPGTLATIAAMNLTCTASNSCADDLLAAATNNSVAFAKEAILMSWDNMDLVELACQTLFAKVAYWAVCWPWAIIGTVGAAGMFAVFFFNVAQMWLGLRPGRRTLPKGVWTIHGKKYDLESFADDHPGGRWAIELGRNRDCTGLFESYHVFVDRPKLEKMMARFEIKGDSSADSDASNATGLIFRCAFHEDVKKMAREHFQGKSHKMTPRFAAINAAVGALYALLLYRFFAGCRLAVVLAPTVGWYFAVNTLHDGSHWAVSHRPWVNRLCAASGCLMTLNSTAWYIQHVVQHHIFTNDVNDVDLYHFLPLARASKFTSFLPHFKWQWFSMFFMVPTTVFHLLFVVPCDLLTAAVDGATGTRRYDQCENLEDLVSRCKRTMSMELLVSSSFPLATFMVYGFYGGWWRLALVYSISSVHFILFTQAAHLSDECMIEVKDGDSWAMRQAASSINYRPDSFFWLFISGGLNMQGLHHVLPGIASCHYVDLWPKFAEVCRKHGLQPKEAPSGSSFLLNFLSWAAELAADTAPIQPKKVD